MATDQSRDTYRGLAILDERAVLNVSESTISQAGPVPSVPVDQSDPRSPMTLQASGQQAAGAQLRVRTQAAGFPASRDGAAFVYRDATETGWYGWDAPNAFTAWEWVHFLDNASTTNQYNQPHVIRLQSGDLLLALRRDGSLGQDRIALRRFDVSGGTWAWVALGTVVPDGTLAAQAWPALVQLPDGRVQLYFWVTDSATNKAQIEVWQSDDDGDTWSLATKACLDTSVSTSAWNLRRIRVAYNAGQMLLVAQIDDAGGLPMGASNAQALTQYASDSMGARYTLIDTMDISTGVNGAKPEVMPLAGGGFMVICWEPNTFFFDFYSLGSAFESILDVTESSLELIDTPTEELTVWSAEDGTWYLVGQSDNLSEKTLAFRSKNEGTNWTALAGSSGATADPITSGGTSYLRDFVAAETCGRSVLVSRVLTTASIDDYSILCLYLGGHSTLTAPTSSAFRDDSKQRGWQTTWLAIDEPDDYGSWTETTSGTPTQTLTETGLRVQCTATGRAYWSKTLTGTSEELNVLLEAELDDGGSLAADRVGLRVRLANGADDYGVTIRLASTGYRVIDEDGGAQLGSDQVLTTSGVFQIKVALAADKVRTWHRAATLPGEPERAWTEGIDETVGNDTGSPAANGEVSFGVLNTGGADVDIRLRTCSYRRGDGAEVLLVDGQDNPADVFPRAYSATPIRLPGLVRLAAIDGPTYVGDIWHVDVHYTNGVALLDPLVSPSPSRRWKQLDTTAAELVYDVSEVSGSDTRIPGSLVVGVYGASTYDVLVDGYDDDTNTWIALADDDGSIGDLGFRRAGDALIPDDTSTYVTTAPTWFAENQLAGAVIKLPSDKYRRAKGNSAGFWSSSANAAKATIFLDPEYLDGTESTGGLMRVGPGERGQVIIVHGTIEYSKIRVKVGTTAPGFGTQLQDGIVFIGRAALFPQEYSWGRVRETTPNTRLETRRGGRRTSKVLGPVRRSVEFGWQDGVDETGLWSDDAPDYITSTTNVPVASVGDVGPLLSGIMEEIRGAHAPVIYLPAVPIGPANEVRLRWPDEHLFGRLVTESIRRETILGDELEDEVIRVASVRVEEEV